MNLIEYVRATTIRGACTCGKCIDAPPEPEKHQPKGHTVDMFFFQVAANPDSPPDAEKLKELARRHRGEFAECDPFDGKEHSYLELGGWIGDQGLALMFMGEAVLVGLCDLLTPRSLGIPDDIGQMMAGQGMVTIKAK